VEPGDGDTGIEPSGIGQHDAFHKITPFTSDAFILRVKPISG
jgi:hypothetical protein